MDDHAMNADTDGDVVPAAGMIASRRKSRTQRVASQIPWFLYVILLFVGMKLTGVNLREPLFEFGPYVLTLVEVLYVIAASAAMAEVYRVSRPGVDNTLEAQLMQAIAIVQIVVFALGAAQVAILEIFHNTEFLVITLMSFVQGWIAVKINARTLKRTIDYGGGGS